MIYGYIRTSRAVVDGLAGMDTIDTRKAPCPGPAVSTTAAPGGRNSEWRWGSPSHPWIWAKFTARL